MDSYEKEMSMPLQKNLSAVEESRLDQLTTECDSMSASLAEISLKRTEVVSPSNISWKLKKKYRRLNLIRIYYADVTRQSKKLTSSFLMGIAY